MDLHSILTTCAETGLKLLQDKEHMPAGHNGPYHDPETPVRNTSHWIITFIKCYQITGENKFLEAAEQCVSYLTRQEVRPYGYTFYLRNIGNKDACNGLIGQAWCIEALVAAGCQLKEPDLLDLAKSIFLSHPFNKKLAAWQVIDIDGSNKGYDLTLNHQIWFAASGAQIINSGIECVQVRRQVTEFLDSLTENIHLYPSGLIYHNIYPRNSLIKLSIWGSENIKRRRIPMPILERLRPEMKMKLRKKAIGYHSFNLYGLGMLKQVFSEHQFWNSNKFNNTIKYGRSVLYKNQLNNNKYSYSFNCTGIEMAFVSHVFCDDTEAAREWLSEQFERSFDTKNKSFTKDTEDPATMGARIYEATRLPNISNVC